MSDNAKAKLRAHSEQDRLQEIEAQNFNTALALVVVTPENLRKLVERCNDDSSAPCG